MDKHAVAACLREMATLLTAQGENPFKIRAYDNGARAIESLDDLEARVLAGTLTEVDGVGDAIAKKVAELVTTGHCAFLDRLRSEVPPGVLALLRLPELGPKRVIALRTAGIESPEALLAACKAGSVAQIKGMTAKLQDKLLQHLETAQTRPERMPIADARPIGDSVLGYVRACPAVLRSELAGSARRWKEDVADLDIVVGTADPAAVMAHFVAYPGASVMQQGDTKSAIRLPDGLQVDLRAVPDEDFATALHHFTGSKAHHVRIRGIAQKKGLTISEWGVHRVADDVKLRIDSEAALYEALGLPAIPPELREDEGEIDAALGGDDFADLITHADIVGVTHAHTTWSDGHGTVEDMARAAVLRGYKWLTITDHSGTANYAHGLDVDRIERQRDEIAAVQERVPEIRLLCGTESDILEDGALDFPDRVLEKLDVIIASVHNRYRQDSAKATERLIRCMRLPMFKIWGHPLGRLIGSRPELECRVEDILDALAESRGAVEINGDPHRLDLAPRWIREARKRGLKFVISPDAHSTTGLDMVKSGVANARKGGVRRGEVLNTMDASAFAAHVRPVA